MRHSWKYSEKDKPKGEGVGEGRGGHKEKPLRATSRNKGGGGDADDRTSKCKWEVFKGGNRKACQGKIKSVSTKK